MRCHHCDFQNPSIAKQCSNCGQVLTPFGDILHNLKKLVHREGYVIVSVDDYYVQFAGDGKDKSFLFEVVSKEFLKSVAKHHQAILDLGFTIQEGSNFHKIVQIEVDYVDKALADIVRQLQRIFKVYELDITNYKIESSFDQDNDVPTTNVNQEFLKNENLKRNPVIRKSLKWVAIVVAIIFIAAIYISEASRLDREQSNDVEQTSRIDTSSEVISEKENSTSVPAKRNSNQDKSSYFVDELSGDTIDTNNGKYISVAVEKYSDTNITFSFSIWSRPGNCAWSPGILKVFVYDQSDRLLNEEAASIDNQLSNLCTQLEEVSLFLGTDIENASYIRAEFTDRDGNKYTQRRTTLGDMVVELKAVKEEHKAALLAFKKEVRSSFSDLLQFKDKNDFHRNGFAVGYKYNAWLKNIKKLKDHEANYLLLMYCNFTAGDLEFLGLDYVNSQGKETDFSSFTKEKIVAGLRE